MRRVATAAAAAVGNCDSNFKYDARSYDESPIYGLIAFVYSAVAAAV